VRRVDHADLGGADAVVETVSADAILALLNS
jgi:hypothetical protein